MNHSSINLERESSSRREILNQVKSEPIFKYGSILGSVIFVFFIFISILNANDNPSSGIQSFLLGLVIFIVIMFFALFLSFVIIFLTDIRRIASSLEILVEKEKGK